MSQDCFETLLDGVEQSGRESLIALADQVSRLAGLLAQDADIGLRERVHSLASGSAGEIRSDIFDEVCSFAQKAFVDLEPSDSQILSNASTPHLVRYLLASLRRFSAESSATATNYERALARAFLTKNRVGQRGKLKLVELEMMKAATNAIRTPSVSKLAHSARNEVATKAAHAVFRKENVDSHGYPIPQDPKDEKRDFVRIEKLLLKEEVIQPLR